MFSKVHVHVLIVFMQSHIMKYYPFLWAITNYAHKSISQCMFRENWPRQIKTCVHSFSILRDYSNIDMLAYQVRNFLSSNPEPFNTQAGADSVAASPQMLTKPKLRLTFELISLNNFIIKLFWTHCIKINVTKHDWTDWL